MNILSPLFCFQHHLMQKKCLSCIFFCSWLLAHECCGFWTANINSNTSECPWMHHQERFWRHVVHGSVMFILNTEKHDRMSPDRRINYWNSTEDFFRYLYDIYVSIWVCGWNCFCNRTIGFFLNFSQRAVMRLKICICCTFSMLEFWN